MGCYNLFLPEIPAFGAKYLIYNMVQSKQNMAQQNDVHNFIRETICISCLKTVLNSFSDAREQSID